MRLLVFLLLVTNLFAQRVGGSSGAGNGGDYIRMKFIAIGENILEYYADGFLDFNISPAEFKKYLNINVIKNSRVQLFDNLGNPVDAIGEPNKIILFEGSPVYETGWHGLFKRYDMVETLVLHELLRAHAINDDNYVYSSKILLKQKLSSSKKHKMQLSEDIFKLIQNTLKNSFITTDLSEEITIYDDAFNLIKAKSNLYLSDLVYKPLALVEVLKMSNSKIALEKLVVIYRRQLKQVVFQLDIIDQLLYENHLEGVLSEKKILTIFRLFSRNLLELSFYGLTDQDKLDMISLFKEMTSVYLKSNKGTKIDSLLNELTENLSLFKVNLNKISLICN